MWGVNCEFRIDDLVFHLDEPLLDCSSALDGLVSEPSKLDETPDCLLVFEAPAAELSDTFRQELHCLWPRPVELRSVLYRAPGVDGWRGRKVRDDVGDRY